jgi:hypothetical protein
VREVGDMTGWGEVDRRDAGGWWLSGRTGEAGGGLWVTLPSLLGRYRLVEEAVAPRASERAINMALACAAFPPVWAMQSTSDPILICASLFHVHA